MELQPHAYQAPHDLDALVAIVKARPIDRLLNYPAPADLRELLQMPRIQAATILWQLQPAGEVGSAEPAGFAMVNYGEDYASLSFEAAPGFSETMIGQHSIAWAERILLPGLVGQFRDLTCSAHPEDRERIALFEQNGYDREDDGVVHMERELNDPIPAPALPPGFVIRAASPEEDETWVHTFQAAFGTQNMTPEYRRAMTTVPGYDLSLDLVAISPNGDLAALVVGSISQEENALTGRNVGFTDPVATHPEYRQRGLSRALLLHSLRLLRERGMQAARLGTSSGNRAMQAAARSAGFRVVSETWRFSKMLRNAPVKAETARAGADHK